VTQTSHTHDPLPEVVKVGNTLLVAGGSHGKFVCRLDLDVRDHRVNGYRFKLIPLFSDAIRPDPEMQAAITRVRAPFAAELARVVGRTDTLLYRRGRFDCSVDDMICAALLEERDAEIALSPGFWWGTSLLPGTPITHRGTACRARLRERTQLPDQRAEAGAAHRDEFDDPARGVFRRSW
jgi:S-sulfosulfanyl-L-cysteine sulfohydrolase